MMRIELNEAPNKDLSIYKTKVSIFKEGKISIAIVEFHTDGMTVLFQRKEYRIEREDISVYYNINNIASAYKK